jgi:hypothetical protein
VSRALGVIGALVVGAVSGACTGDLDPAWQLDHDRIVAVRATPPGIAPGERSTIDALLATKGAKTSVAPPELATVVSPMSLSDVLAPAAGTWVVTAPDEDRLAAARDELELAPGAPVPLQIGVSYAGQTLLATKTIYLGAAADNPTLASVMIDGKPAGSSEIAVSPIVKVPLSIGADDTLFDVNWLTSCGTMHDFDLPQAYLEVQVDDPQAGELAVVLRDGSGGVAWSVWPIHSLEAPQ